MNLEAYEKFKNIPIDEIDESTLVDIKTIEGRTDLPPAERLKYALEQVKNPYFFKFGNIVVKSKFAEGSGCKITDCVNGLLML